MTLLTNFTVMKRFLLIFTLLFATMRSSANSFTGLWAGCGLAPSYNYGVGPSYGLTYYKGIAYGLGIGAQAFYQTYDMYYNPQAYQIMGSTERFKRSYAFFAPMIVSHLTHSGQTQAYVSIGVGYNMGGYDTLHKWSSTDWASANGKYDSMIDGTKSLNKMVFRIGLGLTEYYALGGKLRLAITEDFGLLPSALSTLQDPGNNSFNSDMPRFFRPLYASIRLGITYRTSSGNEDSYRKRISR